MSSSSSGRLLLIVGPSGVGKGTTVNILRERHPEWIFPVSTTTRQPRPGEVDGVDYHFLTPQEFDARIAEDAFLEWAWVHGKERYGHLRSSIEPHLQAGKTVVRDIDIQGCEQIQQKLPPELVVSFFLLPPPREVLIERIRKRAPIDDAELERRLQSMQMEVERGRQVCPHLIQTKNNSMEYPPNEIERILAQLD
jgi:Guanylate kinase